MSTTVMREPVWAKIKRVYNHKIRDKAHAIAIFLQGSKCYQIPQKRGNKNEVLPLLREKNKRLTPGELRELKTNYRSYREETKTVGKDHDTPCIYLHGIDSSRTNLIIHYSKERINNHE